MSDRQIRSEGSESQAERRGKFPFSRPRRFSLRALLIAFTAVAIACAILGYHIQNAKRQAFALTRIEALGGVPLRTVEHDGMWLNLSGKIPEPRYKWLHKFLGDNYFIYVPHINLRNSSVTADNIRSMIPEIKQIRLKEGPNEAGKAYIYLDVAGNPNVDDELVEYLRRSLPQCQVSSPAPRPKGPYEL